jgi:hypothetical protein
VLSREGDMITRWVLEKRSWTRLAAFAAVFLTAAGATAGQLPCPSGRKIVHVLAFAYLDEKVGGLAQRDDWGATRH